MQIKYLFYFENKKIKPFGMCYLKQFLEKKSIILYIIKIIDKVKEDIVQKYTLDNENY